MMADFIITKFRENEKCFLDLPAEIRKKIYHMSSRKPQAQAVLSGGDIMYPAVVLKKTKDMFVNRTQKQKREKQKCVEGSFKGASGFRILCRQTRIEMAQCLLADGRVITQFDGLLHLFTFLHNFEPAPCKELTSKLYDDEAKFSFEYWPIVYLGRFIRRLTLDLTSPYDFEVFAGDRKPTDYTPETRHGRESYVLPLTEIEGVYDVFAARIREMKQLESVGVWLPTEKELLDTRVIAREQGTVQEALNKIFARMGWEGKVQYKMAAPPLWPWERHQ